MKRIFVILILYIIPLLSEAQKDGFLMDDFTFQGSIGAVNVKSAESVSSALAFSTSFGYFIKNNVNAGVFFGFDSQDSLDNFSTGIFTRYYVTPKNKFSFFGTLLFDYISNTNSVLNTKTNGYNINMAPGINYFFTNNLAFEASFGNIGFSSSKPAGIKGAQPTNKISFGVNLSTIKLGIILKTQ